MVRRIFELRATGITPTQIAKKLNTEGVPIPSDYRAQRLGMSVRFYLVFLQLL